MRVGENGLGVAADSTEALKWFRAAALKGAAHAQYKVGRMYEEGIGVAKDVSEAVKWYRMALRFRPFSTYSNAPPL